MVNSSKAHLGNKYVGLDHLRAIAITAVFLYHYRLFKHPQWVDDLFSFGWVGVDLFSVLSGFLIAGQLFTTLKKTNPFPSTNLLSSDSFELFRPF